MSQHRQWEYLLRPFGPTVDATGLGSPWYWALYRAVQRRDAHIVAVMDESRLEEISWLDGQAMRGKAPPRWLFAVARQRREELRQLSEHDHSCILAAAP